MDKFKKPYILQMCLPLIPNHMCYFTQGLCKSIHLDYACSQSTDRDPDEELVRHTERTSGNKARRDGDR